MTATSSEILFEKFEIIEVLKKDEHAAVYLANHIYLSKRIILKVLNTTKLPDQAMVERFKREAKLLAKLDHPSIIKVLDFGTSKEFFYISFEYIEGSSLRNILNSKDLSFDQKKQMMIQLLKGLHYAHSFQIIHRDVKPENIFVDNHFNVKLGDFGLALSSEDSFVTNPYSIVGTPSYMSPEQVRGAKLTPQSDLFSAGVVLFELFTGKNPFLKENVTLTLNEIMSYREDSLDEKIRELPDEIKNIIHRLLRKKPDMRYPGAKDALSDMNVSLDQQTVAINRDERKIKNEKYKAIVLSAAAIAIIFIGVISIQIFNKNQPDNLDKTSEQKTLNQPEQKPTEQTPVQKIDTSSQLSLNITDDQKVDEHENTSSDSPGENVNNPILYGALLVECLPYGDIYLDGERIGTTPMRQPLYFREGEHSLKLVHPDYPIYTGNINVQRDQVTRVRILLDTLMSYIRCEVNPWGDVYINGDKKGTTPFSRLIKVVPGFITLTIKNPYYKDIDTIINARKNDTLRLRFTFKK